MRNLKGVILFKKNEMTKNDFIETILFIIRKVLDYTSSLSQIAPSSFDHKEQKEENDNDNMNTSQSSNEENENTCNLSLEKEDLFSLTDSLYYWAEIMNFNENLLILTLMNIDKILAKDFILSSDNVKNVLFTCMVITQKYYEDESFNDKDYSKILKISPKELIKMEIEFLSLLDFSLNISEEEFNEYKYKMKKIWKDNLLFSFN